MDRSRRGRHGGVDRGVLHMLLGCGLMLVGLALLGTTDVAWGIALLLAAFAVHVLPSLLRWLRQDRAEAVESEEGSR